jgi:hypothetical protein
MSSEVVESMGQDILRTEYICQWRQEPRLNEEPGFPLITMIKRRHHRRICEKIGILDADIHMHRAFE